MTDLLLDLCSGAGGAARGYVRAGFQVVGVDKEPMPRYPYGFCQGDVLATLEYLLDGGELPVWRNGRLDEMLPLSVFDAIHASPPCQGYSKLSVTIPGVAEKYPKLIDPVRELLDLTYMPYVIENVEAPGIPLRNPVRLCGSHFTECETVHPVYGLVGLHRHRLFEVSGFVLPSPGPCDHSLRSVPVYGHGSPGNGALKGPGLAKASREVMGIDWMRRDELTEAIPPVFTEYVGRHLRAALSTRSGRAA